MELHFVNFRTVGKFVVNQADWLASFVIYLQLFVTAKLEDLL
ncbi:hypothetical protein HNO89_003985 [Sporosarcina luteola]|nr:hypothetical protein [Sporosarcina luteola]